MSTSSRRKNTIELASFRSAFVADDTLTTIVPDFDYPHPIPLLSTSVQVGPFQAGIPCKVPLWFALLLQQRSLCSLQAPDWLHTDHLTQVKQHEIQESSLTPTAVEATGQKSTQDPSLSLPFYYAELGQRLTSKTSDKASETLLQDIALIRLDKLRQQFQLLSKQQMKNPNLCVTVPGIASAELTQLKPLITQALNDQRFLATTGAGDSGAPRQKKSTASQDSEEEEEEETPRPNNALRSRLRRFRG